VRRSKIVHLAGQDLFKGPAGKMSHTLPVGPGKVGRPGHRPKVALALGVLSGAQTSSRSGRWMLYFAHRRLQAVNIVLAHLVAQPARAGVDLQGELPLEQAKDASYRLIIDLDDLLELNKVVSRARLPICRYPAAWPAG